MKTIWTFICFLLFACHLQGMVLEGQFTLDSSWRQVAYLSIINNFNDLNTASYHFLIAEMELDSNGRFRIEINGLPQEDHLYRLHVCPVGDPATTIIIGSQNENFIHFISNSKAHISIINKPGRTIFGNIQIFGHPGNQAIQNMFAWKRAFHVSPQLSSIQNGKRIENEMKSQFLTLIDTSSNTLVRLLAFHLLDDMDLSPSIDQYRKLASQIPESEVSPYALQFRNQLAYLDFQQKKDPQSTGGFMVGILTGLLIILLLSGFFYINMRKTLMTSDQANKVDPIDLGLLSIQERRVWQLLRNEMSNKEIASALNIEVTTVKSHIYRIFHKLGIKSRKEAWERSRD